MLKRGLSIILLAVAASLVPDEVLAQNIVGDRVRLNTPGGGGCTARAGVGTPEGVVSGVTCDTYENLTTGEIYKKIGTGTTGWYPVVGPSAATCTTFASCVAQSLSMDYLAVTLKLRTDPSFQSRWSVTTTGTRLESYNGGGWMPLWLNGGPVKVAGGGFQVGASSIVDPGLGNAQIEGFIGKPGYASQTTGWRIDNLGAADFRYLFTDELIAKSFIADLEQALAGGQIISKSVAVVAAPFTVPSGGSISTLTVKDLPSAANMAVFEAGDFVRVRQFSRASGSLSITDAWGTVTGYTDLADGLQSWTFTRLLTNGGAMSTGAVIEPESLVLDYGTPGNGFYEVNAIDGVYGINSPYAQVVTIGNAPTEQTVRARLGNLRGITGIAEYGLLGGTYAATGGRHFIASDQRFELHGIDLSLWNGATRVFRMDPLNLYQSMGNPAPSSFTSGTGCWSGLDAGVFKWRCGDIAGGSQYIAWNGTQLTVAGNIVVTGTSIDAATVVGVDGNTVVSGSQRALLGINSAGNPALPVAASPSGSGLFLGSDRMGYFTAGAWKTYMDNAGNFYLGGTGGVLQYTASTNTLTIAATLSGNGSAITSINGGNIQTNTVTADKINATTLSAITANTGALNVTNALTVGTGGDIRSGATGFSSGNGYWLAYNAGNPQFRVGQALGNRLSWDGSELVLVSSTVEIDNEGITINSGSGPANAYRFSSGSYISGGSSGRIWLNSVGGGVRVDATGGSGVEVVTGGNVLLSSSGDITLDSNNTGGPIMSMGGTTSAAVHPLVMQNGAGGGRVFKKTNGIDGSICGAGVADITFEGGIATGWSCLAPDADVVSLRNEVAELRAMLAQLTTQPQARK